MTTNIEKRTAFRRFEDRRMSLMLSVYETLFGEIEDKERETRILESARMNFQADGAALLASPDTNENRILMSVALGDRLGGEVGEILEGKGIEMLLNLQREAPGAISLVRFKRPAVFESDDWEDLWNRTLKGTITALLSVRIVPKLAAAGLLWMVQSNYSREWSSRDRELIEEVASILSRARDKDLASR